MNVNVGTGPDNWGVWFPNDPKQIPWERYLDECAEAGYEWTELGPYGYMPTDPKTLRKELDKRGIRGAEAAFVFGNMNDRDNYDNLVEETHRAAALAAELGTTTLVLRAESQVVVRPIHGKRVRCHHRCQRCTCARP